MLARHAPSQSAADPPVQLRPHDPHDPLLPHQRDEDCDHVAAADLVKAPVQDRAAVPFQGTPVLRPMALPGRRRIDPLARRAEGRDPRRPKDRRGVRAAARELTVGESGGALRGEPDVGIPAEAEVAARAVDGQPLHPAARPRPLATHKPLSLPGRSRSRSVTNCTIDAGRMVMSDARSATSGWTVSCSPKRIGTSGRGGTNPPGAPARPPRQPSCPGRRRRQRGSSARATGGRRIPRRRGS